MSAESDALNKANLGTPYYDGQFDAYASAFTVARKALVTGVKNRDITMSSSRFTIQTNGLYKIDAFCRMNMPASGIGGLALKVNNEASYTVYDWVTYQGSAHSGSARISALLPMVAGDYFEFWYIIYSNGITSVDGVLTSRFSIYKVG